MRYLFLTPIILLLAFGLCWFLVLPSQNEFSQNKDKLEKIERTLFFTKDYSKSLFLIEKELKEHKDIREKIDKSFPSGLSLPDWLNFFQQVSKDNGLLLKTISPPKKIAKRTGFGEAEFDLSLTGDYLNFKAFLSSLEKSGRKFSIENLSLKTTTQEQPDISMKIKVYFFSKNED